MYTPAAFLIVEEVRTDEKIIGVMVRGIVRDDKSGAKRITDTKEKCDKWDSLKSGVMTLAAEICEGK